MVEIISLIIAILTFFFTAYGILYAVKEYKLHKKTERTTLLCQYHQRYMSDSNIEAVIRYILRVGIVDDNGYLIGYDSSKNSDLDPGIYEKERFMRFFEELELQLEEGNLEESVVCKFFSYYALVFDRIVEFHQDITDYYDPCWLYFHKFIRKFS